MREPALWYISLGHGSALLVVSAVSVHLIVHVTERLAYSLQQATAVVALMTVMQAVGQLGGAGRATASASARSSSAAWWRTPPAFSCWPRR